MGTVGQTLQKVGENVLKVGDKAMAALIEEMPKPNEIVYSELDKTTEVLPVDSLIGEPIEGKLGFFHTIEGDLTKAGFVTVPGTGIKAYFTRHNPTDSKHWYRKIVLEGQDAWEMELEETQGKENN